MVLYFWYSVGCLFYAPRDNSCVEEIKIILNADEILILLAK